MGKECSRDKEEKAEKPAGSSVQSVLIPRSKYSMAQARAWIKAHGYSITKPPDVTDKYYRFRQQDPSKFKRMRTVAAGSGGIKLIIGWR